MKGLMKSLRSRCETLRAPTSVQKGFTLIEMVTVIVILAIVSAITIYFLINSLNVYTMAVNQKTLLDEGKLALERMCRDIRDANAPPANTADSITFTRSNDTAGDNADDSITFQLNTGSQTLQKVNNTTSTSGILAEHVSAFSVTNTANEIQLKLILQLTSGEHVTVQTKVYPKNLPEDVTKTYKNFYQNWTEAIQ